MLFSQFFYPIHGKCPQTCLWACVTQVMLPVAHVKQERELHIHVEGLCNSNECWKGEQGTDSTFRNTTPPYMAVCSRLVTHKDARLTDRYGDPGETLNSGNEPGELIDSYKHKYSKYKQTHAHVKKNHNYLFFHPQMWTHSWNAPGEKKRDMHYSERAAEGSRKHIWLSNWDMCDLHNKL